MIQQVTQFTDSELETIAQIWLQSNLMPMTLFQLPIGKITMTL